MKLEVNLTQNPYDIIIEKGALKMVGQWVKSLWEPQKIALITDNHVGGLYDCSSMRCANLKFR